MKKRATLESRILDFFENAPLESVEMMLGIVKEKVRMRRPLATTKRTRVKRANGVHAEPIPTCMSS